MTKKEILISEFARKNKKALRAIPKDDSGKPLFVYEKIKDIINEKENYVYCMYGNPLFLPTEIQGKEVPIGSTFESWFTGATWAYRNNGWGKVEGQDPEVVDLITPVDEMFVNTDVELVLTDSGEKEEKQVDDRVYNLPIYSAENSATLYEHDAKGADVQISLINAASTYNFKKYVDGEEVEDLGFIADLTDRVEVMLLQDGIESGDTDLVYGALIYIDAVITDDPTPTIESGSLISDEESPTIADFVIADDTITVDPQSAEGANWRVNGITFSPDWDNVKLYLGEYNIETLAYDYRPYVPGEELTQDNDKYRLMPAYAGMEVDEDDWHHYDIVFATE